MPRYPLKLNVSDMHVLIPTDLYTRFRNHCRNTQQTLSDCLRKHVEMELQKAEIAEQRAIKRIKRIMKEARNEEK